MLCHVDWLTQVYLHRRTCTDVPAQLYLHRRTCTDVPAQTWKCLEELVCGVEQVLALLFMARADVGYTVRQAAVHVWKTIVTNTPRTTGEILKTLMDQLITSLGHPSRTTHCLC